MRLFVVPAVGIVLLFLIATAIPPITPLSLSEKIESRIWSEYLRPDGMIESEPGKTTSESQSYGMLIAVVSDDRERFESIWRWTRDNLARPEDNLFSWIWADGSIQDRHSATDADEDIALSLILASRRWDESQYLDAARRIIRDIWEKETKIAGGTRYISGGDWALEDPAGLLLNPSYLSPASYRLFAKIDPEHDWKRLADSSYQALERCASPSGLPRNWCRLDPNGNFVPDYPANGTDPAFFSFDALRVPFRLALDYELAGDPRAQALLDDQQILMRDWSRGNKFFAVYDPEGRARASYESLASYGALMAGLAATQSPLADELFRTKIAPLEKTSTVSFFDLAWLWFGLRFYTGDIPNLMREF